MSAPDAEQPRGCGPEADQRLTGEESARSEYQWTSEDRVALGAHHDASERPLLGAAALGRTLMRVCDGSLVTALGAILVRLSRLERDVRR